MKGYRPVVSGGTKICRGIRPLPPVSNGPRGDAGTDKLSTQNHCPKLKSKQYHDKTVNFLPEIDPILFPKNICQSGRERKKRKFVPAFFQFVYGFWQHERWSRGKDILWDLCHWFCDFVEILLETELIQYGKFPFHSNTFSVALWLLLFVL